MPRQHVWFKRAYRGLYGNRMIQFGNQISAAKNKTRRTWKPNVQKTTLFSETLNERLTCSLTTHVMRCIRKAGGFDQYLVKTKDSELKFHRAITLKQRIIEIRKEEQRVKSKAAHAARMGDGVPGLGVNQGPSEGAACVTHALHPTPSSKISCRGLADIL